MPPMDSQFNHPFALYPHTPFYSPFYHMRNVRTNTGVVYKTKGFVLWIAWVLILALLATGLAAGYYLFAERGTFPHLNKDILSTFSDGLGSETELEVQPNFFKQESSEFWFVDGVETEIPVDEVPDPVATITKDNKYVINGIETTVEAAKPQRAHPTFWSYLVFGAAVGALLGVIIGIIHVISAAIAERSSQKHYKPIREALDSQGRIVICESRVRVFDHFSIPFIGELGPEKYGRLYLTQDALEFYDYYYQKTHKNFLINLHDICYVRARGLLFRRVCVYTMSGKYVFRVTTGQGIAMCCDIRNAMQRGGRSILRPTTRAL